MSPAVFAHGHLRLYLLSLLAERSMHGYELIQALSDRFGGTYVPSAGTIYPRLAKLEEEGLVTKEADGRKTVYAITDAGRTELDARAGDLDGIESELSDSVRRLADQVRTSVTDAMKTLRADLAAAAREARDDSQANHFTQTPEGDDVRVQSRYRLNEAEAALSEFRADLKADLRTRAASGVLEQKVVDVLTTRLREVRGEISALLR
ncbi:MAG: PadR family transcriptional regulator [Pseudolysinimonas sp.]